MIDALGLKGYRIGGAVVSEKHANFIVNDQKGTAADVRGLAEHVRREVREAHGIELRFEVEFTGDWSGWTPRRSPDARPAAGARPAETPVAVVFGGPSAEHDVSIVSGTAILARSRARLSRGVVGDRPRRRLVAAP